MRARDLNLFSLSKLATNELLVNEQIEQLETSKFRYFKSFLSSQKNLKRRVLTSKIFGAIIFGILPIIPLLTYFEISSLINEINVPIERILFAGSILFGIYFLFQFFNFFLMAMLSTMKILSGTIFDWFETLPISRTKIKKLIFLTILRSLDIPLIAITIAFPIIMLIGTLDIVIFLICLGVSTLDTIFSLTLLILFSERLNRISNVNNAGDKKTHLIRLSNLASYIIIVIGSVILIQWALNSIDEFIIAFVNSQSPTIIVMILSLIPYPIAPGYLISSFISPKQIPTNIWLNILIGFCLFLILAYVIYEQSIKGIKKSSYSKFKIDKNTSLNKKAILEKQIILKIKNPVWAFIRKDIIISTRNLKSFLSFVMPIVIGFVFTLTYNSVHLRGVNPFDINIIFNVFAIFGFNLIVSGMIIHGILNIEESGTSILAALPIIPRDQAKSKLYLMLLIQTIAVLAPSLMYLGLNVFLKSLCTALLTLPLVLLLLIIMFEIRIYFFGKLKNSYIIAEVKTEKKIVKWTIIYIIGYSIYFWVFTSSFMIYNLQDSTYLIASEILFMVIGLIFTYIIFIRLFPLKRFSPTVQEREGISPFEVKQTWFTKHPWISIIIILGFIILISYLISLLNNLIIIFYLNNNLFDAFFIEIWFRIFLISIFYVLLLIFINPLILGVPYGKMQIKHYFNLTTLGDIKFSRRKVFLSITIVILTFLLFELIFLIPYGELNFSFFFFQLNLLFVFYIYVFWKEFLSLGSIFPLILSKLNKKKAVILNSLITSIFIDLYFSITESFIIIMNNGVIFLYQNFIEFLWIFIINVFSAFLYIKTKNLFITSLLATILSALASPIIYVLIVPL